MQKPKNETLNNQSIKIETVAKYPQLSTLIKQNATTDSLYVNQLYKNNTTQNTTGSKIIRPSITKVINNSICSHKRSSSLHNMHISTNQTSKAADSNESKVSDSPTHEGLEQESINEQQGVIQKCLELN